MGLLRILQGTTILLNQKYAGHITNLLHIHRHQVSIGKLKRLMTVFSRIQYFLSFIVSKIRTIPAFLPVCIE